MFISKRYAYALFDMIHMTITCILKKLHTETVSWSSRKFHDVKWKIIWSYQQVQEEKDAYEAHQFQQQLWQPSPDVDLLQRQMI